jgi:hypothetical protein
VWRFERLNFFVFADKQLYISGRKEEKKEKHKSINQK